MNRKVNVTFQPEVFKELEIIAQKRHISISEFIRELTLEALERREDIYLSTLASTWDKSESEIFNHEETWGKT